MALSWALIGKPDAASCDSALHPRSYLIGVTRRRGGKNRAQAEGGSPMEWGWEWVNGALDPDMNVGAKEKQAKHRERRCGGICEHSLATVEQLLTDLKNPPQK
jgi:hypothetical protein